MLHPDRFAPRWSSRALWLLLPTAVIDWFAFVPEPVVVGAFVLGLLGLLAIATAGAVRATRGRRGAAVGAGMALLAGGIVWLAMNPIPATIPGLASWWPAAITLPQAVAAAYWELVGLGAALTGVAMLGTLLVLAVIAPGRTTTGSGSR
ncbi:hypothetical protein [Curtobacterium ammoniigenes]|uniref:hypothetical protein n=1 Tax=Curtobacterium ammoniigenes TaxID=395387 RepID=UPI00082B0619|nr:hypothetical protein [Curtobacterium ammoniigenes]